LGCTQCVSIPGALGSVPRAFAHAAVPSARPLVLYLDKLLLRPSLLSWLPPPSIPQCVCCPSACSPRPLTKLLPHTHHFAPGASRKAWQPAGPRGAGQVEPRDRRAPNLSSPPPPHLPSHPAASPPPQHAQGPQGPQGPQARGGLCVLALRPCLRLAGNGRERPADLRLVVCCRPLHTHTAPQPWMRTHTGMPRP
jgi:hypothetical protein